MSTVDYNHGGDKQKRKAARKAAKEMAAQQREDFKQKLAERKPVSPQTIQLLSAAMGLGAFDVLDRKYERKQ